MEIWKKIFSVAEELIVPAAVVLGEIMVDKAVEANIRTVLLSCDAVSLRIDEMGTDIKL